MPRALKSFRDAQLNPLAVTGSIPPTPGTTPGNIANQTGATAPCGFIPDVYGNNAYFNNICANSIGPSFAIAGTLTGTIQTVLPINTIVTIPWQTHTVSAPPPIGIPADNPTGPFKWMIAPVTGYYLCTVIGLGITPFTSGTLLLFPIDNLGAPLANLSPIPLAGVNGNVEFTIVQFYNAGQFVGIGIETPTAGIDFTNSGADFTLVLLGK